MKEPRFRDTVLYKMLKSGGFVGDQILQGMRRFNGPGRRRYIEGRPNPNPEFADNPLMNVGAHPDAPTTGETLLGAMGDITRLAGATTRTVTAPVRPIVTRTTSMAEDAGSRLGHVLGDMFGKINTDASPYDDSDIVALLNDKEEIEVLNRETERLRRIARIQARKREKIKDMTEKALRSPYL